MKAYGTNTKRSGFKLAQLCQAADFHPSTVHYYVKIGVLHKPRKVGLGVYLYDDSHLKTLKKIRALRTGENLPLSDIKDRLQSDPEIVNQAGATNTTQAEQGLPGVPPPDRGIVQEGQTRTKILELATQLFSRKGYEGARISDITDTLDMAKGSFYLHFKDKRELFIACMERLPHLIVPERMWEDIAREGDYTVRQVKRTVAFLKAFPSHAGILNLVKMAAMGEDPGLAQKANEAIASIVEPIMRDFRRAVTDGIVRDMDEEFFAYAVLGIAENVAYKLMTDTGCDLYRSVEKCVDLISRGLIPETGARPEAAVAQRPSGKITDVKGEVVKVREILFGGRPYLVGRLGEGEVRLDTEKIAFILLDHTGTDCIVEVTLTNDEKTTLEQDGNLIVSAASSVGLYTIPFHRLRSISFV